MFRTIDRTAGRGTATMMPGVGDSIRWRLPIAIAVVIIATVGIVLAVAFYEVKASLIQAAGSRALGASSQLASLFAQSAQQRRAELQNVAAHAAVREYLLHPDESTRQAARLELTSLTSPIPQVVELWTNAGEKALSVPLPPGSERGLPPGSAPAAAGISPLQRFRNSVFTETSTGVLSLPSAELYGTPAQSRLGFLVVRRPIMVSGNAGTVTGLVGNGAAVKIGNTAGEVWTDLSQAVEAPPVDRARGGVAGYRSADGRRQLGATAAIDGTPWSVWVEFPESVVLAPARSFLRRMTVIALGVLLIAAVCLRAMTERLLKPLSALTQASDAIAAGDYSRRVSVTRRDEFGRLGAAFNTMTARVEQAHHELESRVQQRTAAVEETSRVLAERLQELKESREELDQFFSLSPDMLCIADLKGRLTRVNAAWREALGWDPEELTAAPYASFVHPDDVDATMAVSAQVAEGRPAATFENRYRCKDGSYRWLSWNAAPVLSRGLIYAAARDVTLEKRTARDLETRAEELAALNGELESFSYSVSHDLRAPLRHIGGFAAMLQESGAASLDANGHRLLRTIIDAAAQMGRLIDDLLGFSRVGRTPLNLVEITLGPLVHDVRQEVMIGVKGHPITWHVHDLPVVRADRALLRLVLVNLLANAVKYSSTRTPAVIEIGTAPGAADEVVIFVRDNGVGFDMQYAHKLFGVFQRLHSDEEFEGTGIGLANVNRIVHRHGGRAWAEGELDHGATFSIALPKGHHA